MPPYNKALEIYNMPKIAMLVKSLNGEQGTGTGDWDLGIKALRESLSRLDFTVGLRFRIISVHQYREPLTNCR